MSRSYRELFKKSGQSSPSNLAHYVVARLNEILINVNRPVSLLDVGAGSGEQMTRITTAIGLQHFSQRVGLDWSMRAVELLENNKIYDKSIHCQSSNLPFADKEFDVAMSIENLEHLYYDAVIPAIEELKRVAHNVIIITPLPKDVINMQWLGNEIPAAESDSEPLGRDEYVILEGAVHKSTVYPASMTQAGFWSRSSTHGVYSAESTNINTSQIQFVGISAPEETSTEDYRMQYVSLLRKSQELKI